jgi:hypothetical protein
MKRLRPVLAVGAVLAAGLATFAIAGPERVDARLRVTAASRHDTSAALRALVTPWKPTAGSIVQGPGRHAMVTTANLLDPVQQTSARVPARARLVTSFEGLGGGYGGGYAPEAIPPDTVGGVGRTQYVQWVNSSFAIFDKKTGAHLLGPVAGNTLWKGFGGPCEKNNDGDPVVTYDRAADRWVLQQFVASAPYFECLAVSKTSDATGAYHRYAFGLPAFGDYPKSGVWSHSYVQTYNMFNGESGSKVCALERAAMLAGRTARQVCFQLPTSEAGPASGRRRRDAVPGGCRRRAVARPVDQRFEDLCVACGLVEPVEVSAEQFDVGSRCGVQPSVRGALPGGGPRCGSVRASTRHRCGRSGRLARSRCAVGSAHVPAVLAGVRGWTPFDGRDARRRRASHGGGRAAVV